MTTSDPTVLTTPSTAPVAFGRTRLTSTSMPG